MMLSTQLKLASLALASVACAQDASQLSDDLGNVDALFASDSGYTDATKAYNQRYNYQPIGLAYPTTPEEVATAVKAAAQQNITVGARGGGHSYAARGLGGQDGTLVIDMSNLADISVDTDNNQVSIGGGARLGDVALALNDQGRAMPHGSCAYVGVGGHFALGGFGFPSRLWGLSLDNIVAYDVVLPNGTIASGVTSDSYPDLFWGLQGAGNAFGVITKYTMKTYAAPESATYYSYAWDLSADQAIESMQAWQDFVDSGIPAELGSELTYGKGSQAGQLTFQFSGNYYGSQDSFQNVVQPFLSKMPADPSTNNVNGNWIDVVKKNANGQPLDTSTEANTRDTFYAKSLMTPALNDAAGKAFINYLANEGYSSDTAWFIQQELYGGSNSKINSVASDATAFAHRSAMNTFQFYASSSSYAPPYPEDGFQFLDSMVNTITSNQDLGPNPPAYINYIDDRLDNALQAYYGDNAERLTSLKKEFDPQNLFGTNIFGTYGSTSPSSSTSSSTDPDSDSEASTAKETSQEDNDSVSPAAALCATNSLAALPLLFIALIWTIS